LNPLNVKV